MNKVTLVHNGEAAKIYIDSGGADYDGISLVARSFADDIALVTGTSPAIVTDGKELAGTIVIAGSIGNNNLLESLIAQGKLDVSSIVNKRECYQIRVVEQPQPGVDRAIVIAGSDKRGTIYGIYHLSKLIGVSPWVYWGDVTPERKSVLTIPEGQLHFTSKEPSVKYRGIFINDEWPSFGSWTMNAHGGFNELTYEKVFQLILRLRGNYLWPAMWSATFSEDGKSHPRANAELANAYGIVMGTSHHEPLFRAGEEWQKIYKQYSDSNEWSFITNREAITKFWEDGIIRNKNFENVITLGMRGEKDSELGGGLAENIQLLKDIIIVQKELLRKHGLEKAPQVLTVYKEVETFWYGSDEVPGLKHWDVLDDVLIMLCEDNFGNMRKLPTEGERDRESGWGMYYHFDYHGGPRSYEWVNSTPLEKVWEQMSMGHDYGVRELWVVNTGDLKPMELPISYFLDLAYDFDAWGTSAINRTREYTRLWAEQQFGGFVDEETVERIAGILAEYTRMNGKLKPEVTYADSFSYEHYNEAERVLSDARNLVNEAEKVREKMPEARKDAYYQLVYYPAVASANVKMMQIYAGFNQKYAAEQSGALANRYAELTYQAIELDKQLQTYYNEEMSGGKWRGIMSSAHVGYKNWNAEGWEYPEVSFITPVDVDLEDAIPSEERCEETLEHTDGTIAADGLPGMTFVEAHRVVSIEAEHTAKRVAKSNVEWKTIDHYGKTLSSVKMFPTTVSFERVEDAPYLEYRIYVQEAGEFILTVYTAPTNNLSDTNRLKYGVSLDDGDVVVASSIPDDFEGGNLYKGSWSDGVLENIHKSTTSHTLTAGLHVLRFYGLDAGLVLQKLVISRDPLPYSFFGPKESYYVARS